MTKMTVKDLSVTEELDSKAMAAISGGGDAVNGILTFADEPQGPTSQAGIASVSKGDLRRVQDFGVSAPEGVVILKQM